MNSKGRRENAVGQMAVNGRFGSRKIGVKNKIRQGEGQMEGLMTGGWQQGGVKLKGARRRECER